MMPNVTKWSVFQNLRSHLEYANVVWGPSFITNLNIIESVQDKPQDMFRMSPIYLTMRDSLIQIFLLYPIIDLEQT